MTRSKKLTDESPKRPRPAIPAAERAALQVRDAVSFSALSRSRLYRLMAEGKIESFTVGGRRLIVTESLVAFLNSHRVAAAA